MKIITAENISSALKVLPNPSLVLKQKGAQIDLYHRVAQQPDVFSKSQNYKDAISAMTITANDDFFQTYLNTKSINTRELVRWAVSARDYGFAVIEIIEYTVLSGKTVPSKFKLCKPEKFGIGKEGELRYITRDNPDGIDIKAKYPNKFIWLKNESSDIQPYGIALYDMAYWLAVGLNGNFEAIMKFAEYDGADKWIGYHTPDATLEQKNELLTSLLRIKANGVSVVPDGSRVEAVEYKGRTSSTNLYTGIDEVFRRKLEQLWLGTDLLMKDNTGSYSSSNIGFKIREDAIAQGVYLVMDCLQQIHGYIAAINGSSLPELELSMTAERAISKEEAETDQIYFGMGLRPTKAFFINRGYKENEFEIDAAPAAAPADLNFSTESELDKLFKLYANPK